MSILLKGKGYAFAKLKNWNAITEKKVGNKMKKFRLDRGGDFTSSEFADNLKRHGIKHKLVTVYILCKTVCIYLLLVFWHVP